MSETITMVVDTIKQLQHEKAQLVDALRGLKPDYVQKSDYGVWVCLRCDSVGDTADEIRHDDDCPFAALAAVEGDDA